MMKSDEFNNSHAGNDSSFEFGLTAPSLNKQIENVTSPSDLNDTTVNNDRIEEMSANKKKATDIESNREVKDIAKASGTSAHVVETVSAITIATVAASVGIGIKVSESLNASFSFLQVSANEISYRANIDSEADKGFKISLFNDSYSKENLAKGGANKGEFKGLELGKTYTLQIARDSGEIVTSQRITTKELSRFSSFVFMAEADFEEDCFFIGLDYVDDYDYYSDFGLTLSDPENIQPQRYYAIDKKPGRQKIFFNEDLSPQSSAYLLAKHSRFNYVLSYKTSEFGAKENVIYRQGQLHFGVAQRDLPIFKGIEWDHRISRNGEIAIRLDYSDPLSLLVDANMTVQYKDSVFQTHLVSSPFWQRHSLHSSSLLDEEIDGEATIKIRGMINPDYVEVPNTLEDLDYYPNNLNSHEILIYEGKAVIKKEDISKIYGISFLDDGLIENNMCHAELVYFDDLGIFSDGEIRIDNQGSSLSFDYRFSEHDWVIPLEIANHEGVADVERLVDDLVNHPSEVTFICNRKEGDNSIRYAASKERDYHFRRHYRCKLKSVDFFSFGCVKGKLAVQLDYSDPFHELKAAKLIVTTKGNEQEFDLSLNRRKQNIGIFHHSAQEDYSDPHDFKLIFEAIRGENLVVWEEKGVFLKRAPGIDDINVGSSSYSFLGEGDEVLFSLSADNFLNSKTGGYYLTNGIARLTDVHNGESHSFDIDLENEGLSGQKMLNFEVNFKKCLLDPSHVLKFEVFGDSFWPSEAKSRQRIFLSYLNPFTVTKYLGFSCQEDVDPAGLPHFYKISVNALDENAILDEYILTNPKNRRYIHMSAAAPTASFSALHFDENLQKGDVLELSLEAMTFDKKFYNVDTVKITLK